MLLLALFAILSLALTACGGGGEEAAPAGGDEEEAAGDEEEAAGDEEEAPMEMTAITIQLQWFNQSQFAGYFAAKDLGYYADEGLDVTILEGAVEINPAVVVAAGEAEFGVAWTGPRTLVGRDAGADLVVLAQIFQRSPTLEVAWADSGIETIDDLAGKNVGTWGFGNEAELYAGLRSAGIDPENPDDVTIVQQQFDMSALLNREIDAAQAMVYNEYAQVLEAVNPETGELYQPEDLVVIDFNEVGTAMLQDGIFASEAWLADNEDVASAFLRATLRGWIFCRDSAEECLDIVLAQSPILGRSHMDWQLNEINRLIWPSPAGIGVMDQALFDQTVATALDFGILENEPDDGAFRNDLVEAALADLEGEGLDVNGAGWEARVVEVVEGGQ
jgi:NitT/TauT family transport system substrate-binding protein